MEEEPVSQSDVVSPHLFVDELPKNYVPANTDRVHDWSQRAREEDRLASIARAFICAGLGITGVELVDSVIAKSPWPSCLIVTPVDLLRQQGIDPEKRIKPERYCRLADPPCHAIRGVMVVDHLDDCLSYNGARLDSETLTAWLTLPTTQEKGAPLIIRRMAVCPSIRFDCDGTICNIAPLHAPNMFANLSAMNVIKRVLPGDLIVAATLFIGEDHLIPQVRDGTCPWSDIPGTKVCFGGFWSDRPRLDASPTGVWLGSDEDVYSNKDFGPVGCAWE